MAVKLEKGSTCAKTIENLLSNRKRLKDMKSSCESFDKSASSEYVFALIKDLIEKKN